MAAIPINLSASASSAATATAANNFETVVNFGAGYVSTPFDPSQSPATTSEAVAATNGPAQGGQLGGALASLSPNDKTIIYVIAGIAGLVLLTGVAYFVTHRH